MIFIYAILPLNLMLNMHYDILTSLKFKFHYIDFIERGSLYGYK
ncbi:protein of unknown function [Clostridium beijerinckii]|nr:protein of unknown function [Clostridium beijerinckii]